MSLSTHPDGHPLLDGARWHSPKMGSPTECSVIGCDRVLGQTHSDDYAEDDAEDEAPTPSLSGG